VRRATPADGQLFDRFVRSLYDEVTQTTNDPMLTASGDSFIANWMSWFELHVGRETGLVLFGALVSVYRPRIVFGNRALALRQKHFAPAQGSFGAPANPGRAAPRVKEAAQAADECRRRVDSTKPASSRRS